MMGFRTFDYGGGGESFSSSSSSTSNLSPLAPPFTIDPSLPKPNSNPYRFDQFAGESPFRLSSSASPPPSWPSRRYDWLHLYSPPPGPPPPPPPPLPPTSFSNVFSNHPNLEFDSMYATGFAPSTSSCSSSGSYDQLKPYYFGGSSTSTNTIPNLSPAAATATTTVTSYGFPHGQHSEKLANTLIHEVDGDPYYTQSQYQPVSISERKSSHSVVVKKPDGSDILTMSGSTPFEMSTTINYTHSYSGLEYTPSWGGGLWNGTSEWGEQGTRKNSDGGILGWPEMVHAGSSACSSSLKEGASTVDGLNVCEEASGTEHGFSSVEPLAGKGVGQRGTDLLSPKCSSSIFTSSVFPQMPELPYPEEPCTGSVMNSWSRLNANNSFNSCFSQLDSSVGDLTGLFPFTTYSSAGAIPRSSTIDTSSSAPESSSTSTNAIFIDRAPNACVNYEDLPGYTPFASNIEELLISLSVEGKENIANTSSINNQMDRTDQIFKDSSPTGKHLTLRRSAFADNSLNNVFNGKEEHQVNHFNFPIPSTFTAVAASAAAAAGDSVKSSLERFDQFTPSVDSPCWKGTPAFRYSPFTGQDAGTPCNASKFQGLQVFPFNTDYPVIISSGNSVSNENGHSVDCNLSKPSMDGNEVPFYYGSHRVIKEGFLPGDSKCSSKLKPFQMIQSSNEEDGDTFPREHASACRVGDTGIDVNNAPDGSSPVPSNAKQHVSTSPSSVVNATIGHTEPLEEGPGTLAKKLEPKLDARLLVNAMHNLSELLLATCSNGVNALEEQDLEVLQRVTSNLNTYASMKDKTVRPMPELHYPHKVVKSQVTGEKASDIQSQSDESSLEDRMCPNLCNKKQEMFQDFVSEIGDTDFKKDTGLTQRIKKLLKEDSHDVEETIPSILLYKNLWLEAEAALCSIKYSARLESVKIEMEKHKLQQEKESYTVGKSINVEKQSSSEVFSGHNSSDILSPNIRESLIRNTSIQEASQLSTSNQEGDDEVSVMAILHILKSRVDNSSSVSTERKQSSSKVSSDHSNSDIMSPNIIESSIRKNSTQEAGQSSTSNQEDVEASVMARLHILKCRVDNSSSINMEGKQLLESIADGHNADAAGGFSDDRMKARPTEVGNLGFARRSKLCAITRDISEDGTSDMKHIPTVKYQNANYSKDELVVDEDVPEQVMEKEFYVCVPEESIIQSCIPDSVGKRLSADSYDSPSSSDWEHVMKDELTWQN